MNGNISIVIGSWGSYNECNERALGSKWLDLSDYSDWEEIVDELKKEGFELDGIDEELFIQDVEGIDDGSVNWDYVNPEELFNTLNASGVLDDDEKYEVFCAFLEVRCFDDFEERVKSHGHRWNDDIDLWRGYDWEDYGSDDRIEIMLHYVDTPITPKPIEYDKDENPEGESLRGSLIYTTKIFVDNDIFKGMNKKILEPTFKETQKMPVLIEIRG